MEYQLISKYGLDTYKKMIEEAHYQDMKKTWYFHDSSWYMRGATGMTEKAVMVVVVYKNANISNLHYILNYCPY